MPADPRRTLRELRELHALTSDAKGAQRVCWTEPWVRARRWLRERLAELPVAVDVDEAGNLWATLAGGSPRTLVIGGHLDSVPDGGWLDGTLNVLAGLELLRALAVEAKPPVTVRLVDWADEEGARFGRSLFGSGLAAGTLAPEELRGLRDSTGAPIEKVLAEHGVDLARAPRCRARLRDVEAYLELHIEQGPVLERVGLPLGVVTGTVGVEQRTVRFCGQAAHAGATPIDGRRDAAVGATRLLLELREIARCVGGVATAGAVVTRPGLSTVVPGWCELAVDLRHPDSESLARMLSDAMQAGERIGREEGLELAWTRPRRIEPVAFDETLVALAEHAVLETAGAAHRLPSGAMHDATEVARSGVPTAMLFVQSLGGLSHSRQEDTRPEHLELAVRALERLTARTIERMARDAVSRVQIGQRSNV